MVKCEFCGSETEWLTPKQVAQLFGLSKQRIRQFLEQGRFPGAEKVPIKGQEVWRIPSSAVLVVLQGRQASG